MQTKHNPQQEYYLLTKIDNSNPIPYCNIEQCNISFEKELQKYNYTVDVDEMKNIFKIIHCNNNEANNAYKIVDIFRQHENHFKVNDIIYYGHTHYDKEGICSFHTKNYEGKPYAFEIEETCIIEKEKIRFIDLTIEKQIRCLLNDIDNFKEYYAKELPVIDYTTLEKALENFIEQSNTNRFILRYD